MSFGFSVGDFIEVGRLISHVISSLRASSEFEYQELVLELHGLKRALDEVEHLKYQPNQQASVNGVKAAALICQYPLDEFAGKLKKFQGMDITSKRSGRSKLGNPKSWGQKLRWGFCMQDEVAKLRTYLAAHVGSLNMRLISLGLYA